MSILEQTSVLDSCRLFIRFLSISHRNDLFFHFCFWTRHQRTHRTISTPYFYLRSHQSDTRLDVVVRPHGWHLALERLKRELERRTRIPDLELLQHARVQDA